MLGYRSHESNAAVVLLLRNKVDCKSYSNGNSGLFFLLFFKLKNLFTNQKQGVYYKHESGPKGQKISLKNLFTNNIKIVESSTPMVSNKFLLTEKFSKGGLEFFAGATCCLRTYVLQAIILYLEYLFTEYRLKQR